MNYFYVGSKALNYWCQKYFSRIWRPCKDTDISHPSLSLSELQEQYPDFDYAPIEFTKECFFNEEGYYIEDNDECYATPEYLLLTYYRRMRRCNFSYSKYNDDISKCSFLKKIIQVRGNWDKTIETMMKNNIDVRVFSSKNEYVYRILPSIHSDEIICGEFALMYYYELCDKTYSFNCLDLHISNYNEEKPDNRCGSKIIKIYEEIPYNEYDGLKIETLKSLENMYPDMKIPPFVKEQFSY